jgi:hypothetical protein
MDKDTPYPCAPGGFGSRLARFALFPTLTLAALACLGTPAFTAFTGGVDPRADAVALASIEPSPDGRWVAMTCTGTDGQGAVVWLVDLTRVLPARALEGDLPTTPEGFAWSAEGHLGIDFARRRTGRHWVDPETGGLLWIERDWSENELDGGWAEVAIRKKASGKMMREVLWVERDALFELPGRTDHELQLSSEPGIVFYATRERGVQRIYRHDMLRQVTEPVYEIESGTQVWSVSPDGLSIAVRDDARLRVIDATDGETSAGPWPHGTLEWLQDGSRFARLSAAGHDYLLDLWSGNQVHLGEQSATSFELHVLADGRFLIHTESQRLDLMDADGELLRNLIPGDPVSETAAR